MTTTLAFPHIDIFSSHYTPTARIRRAASEDAAAMGRVLTPAITALSGRGYTDEQIAAWVADETREQYLDGPSFARAVFVAESGGKIVGFSRLSGSEVEALYVHPAQKHKGIGKLLLSALERTALARNVEHLKLDAAVTAVGFYVSHGYEIIGRSSPVCDNGVILPCIRMAKNLRSLGSRPSGQPSEPAFYSWLAGLASNLQYPLTRRRIQSLATRRTTPALGAVAHEGVEVSQ